jgi:hypothetical protein
VNGNVLPCAVADDPLPLEPDELDVPLASVDGAVWESDVLPVEEELLEDELPEDDELPELDEFEFEFEFECEVEDEPVSGSTYCWSPAEVLVPDASTAAAPANEPANRPTRHASVRTTRRTTSIQPGFAEDAARAARQRRGWTM